MKLTNIIMTETIFILVQVCICMIPNFQHFPFRLCFPHFKKHQIWLKAQALESHNVLSLHFILFQHTKAHSCNNFSKQLNTHLQNTSYQISTCRANTPPSSMIQMCGYLIETDRDYAPELFKQLLHHFSTDPHQNLYFLPFNLPLNIAK